MSYPKQIVLSFLFAVFLSITAVAKQDLRLITYGELNQSNSIDLIILIDNILAQKDSPLELVDQDLGRSYRLGDTYLLTGDNKNIDLIKQVWAKSKKKNKAYHYIESARSMLVIPKTAPKKLVDLITSHEDSFSKYGEAIRYWSELRPQTITGGELPELGYRFIRTPNKAWNVDKTWHPSYFLNYKVKFAGQEVVITALPKNFGGMSRATRTIKKLQSSNAIVLGAGGITPFDTSRSDYAVTALGKLGQQFVAAHFYEIASKRTFIDQYYQQWNQKPPLEFLSANVFIKEGDKEKLLFKPYEIVEKNGLKVALIGVTGTNLNASLDKNSIATPWLAKVEIKDIWQTLKTTVLPEVRKKADIVVVFGMMKSDEYGELKRDLRYVDFVVRHRYRQFVSPTVKSFEVKDFANRFPMGPIAELMAREQTISYADISVRGKDLQAKLQEVVLDHRIPQDSSDDMASKRLSELNKPKEFSPILPDPRKIYPGQTRHIAISKEEFANAAAYIMRHYTHSEVAVFSVQLQKSDIPGQVNSTILSSWIRPEEELISLYLSGQELLDLKAAAEKAQWPHQVAIAGISKNGKVNGATINPLETYRVITSTAVTEDSQTYPMLKNSKRKFLKFIKQSGVYHPHEGGVRVNLTDYISEILIRKWKYHAENSDEKTRTAFYRRLLEGGMPPHRGFWLLDFKNLRLQYSKLNTPDITAFANVSDSRLATANQETLGGAFDFSAIYRKSPYISETGIRSVFSKTEVDQADGTTLENITADDLVFFSNIGFPLVQLKNWPKFASQAGPFFEVAYDTEFDKGTASELEKNIQGTLGWKFFDGQVIKNFSFGVLNETSLVTGQEKNEWGISTRLESAYPFFSGSALWKTELVGQYFFDSDKDSNADLKHRVIFDNYLDLKLFGKFTFGPYYKVFHFASKVSDDQATQTEFGVSLNFSSLWKPRFESSPF